MFFLCYGVIAIVTFVVVHRRIVGICVNNNIRLLKLINSILAVFAVVLLGIVVNNLLGG